VRQRRLGLGLAMAACGVTTMAGVEAVGGRAWNDAGYMRAASASSRGDTPVLKVFECRNADDHHDRPMNPGGEPGLTETTREAIALLRGAAQNRKGSGDRGYFVMVQDTLIFISGGHSHVCDIAAEKRVEAGSPIAAP
jgi:hypothetical protein